MFTKFTRLVLILIALFVLTFQVNANGYNYGHNYGYRYGYSSPYYTYSYPSYYTPYNNYYAPYYYYPTQPAAPPVQQQDNTDKVLKELMLRKLLEEQQPNTPTNQPRSLPLTQTPPTTSLTPEEVAQLREVLKALREKAEKQDKPMEKKD